MKIKLFIALALIISFITFNNSSVSANPSCYISQEYFSNSGYSPGPKWDATFVCPTAIHARYTRSEYEIRYTGEIIPVTPQQIKSSNGLIYPAYPYGYSNNVSYRLHNNQHIYTLSNLHINMSQETFNANLSRSWIPRLTVSYGNTKIIELYSSYTINISEYTSYNTIIPTPTTSTTTTIPQTTTTLPYITTTTTTILPITTTTTVVPTTTTTTTTTVAPTTTTTVASTTTTTTVALTTTTTTTTVPQATTTVPLATTIPSTTTIPPNTTTTLPRPVYLVPVTTTTIPVVSNITTTTVAGVSGARFEIPSISPVAPKPIYYVKVKKYKYKYFYKKVLVYTPKKGIKWNNLGLIGVVCTNNTFKRMSDPSRFFRQDPTLCGTSKDLMLAVWNINNTTQIYYNKSYKRVRYKKLVEYWTYEPYTESN